MKKILFIFIAILISITANATKYYVATAANGGDNGNTGAIGSPWLTLTYACTQVTTAGDTIMVGVGEFTEAVQSALAVGVSIMGAGATSILKYTYANSTWSNACIELESATEGTLGNQSISHLTIDGETTAYHGILVGRRSYVKLHDLVMVDFRYNAINIRGSYVAETEPSIYAVGNELYNCSITNCSVKAYVVGSASGNGQVRYSFQDDIDVHDNIFNNTLAAAGTSADNLDLTLGYNKNMKFYRNKSYKPDHNGADWNIHIESWDGMGGNHIYDNEFWGGGMQIDIGGHFNIKGTSDYSFLVENNLFTDTTQKAYVSGLFGCGIAIEGDTRDVIVRKNYFSNIGKGIGINSAEYATPTRYYSIIGVKIHYNKFINIGYTNQNSWNIELTNESVNTVVEDIFIDNNVIISNPAIQSEAALSMMPKGTMSNIRLRNNIIQGMAMAPIYLYYYTGQVSNVYNQNNILYNNGNSNLILYATTPPVINYVVSDTIMTDPLFIGGSPYSYALQSTSPAINAGLDVGLSYDYTGRPIYLTPDIGAYEYGTFPASTGLGWEPKYFKENVKDTLNINKGWKIKGETVTASARSLNRVDGVTSNIQTQLDALKIPIFTSSITIAGDTTVTAVIGKIVYQAADSSFYGCRSTVANKKWYKLNE